MDTAVDQIPSSPLELRFFWFRGDGTTMDGSVVRSIINITPRARRPRAERSLLIPWYVYTRIHTRMSSQLAPKPRGGVGGFF